MKNLTDKVFKFYSDAGHGWLAVKRSILADLGILGEISPYSYQKGATVYLEEDCDVAKFFAAFEARFQAKPLTAEGSWCNWSPIRSYPRFTVEG